MKIEDYGQMLSALAGYESFLLQLWGFFYAGHSALVVALYYRKRKLSFVEMSVLLLVYSFAWKVNFSGIEDAYKHLQYVYDAVPVFKPPSEKLIAYYQSVKFWGEGAGFFDRQWVVPAIYWIAFSLTWVFVISCHVVMYENWWMRGAWRRWCWHTLLPTTDASEFALTPRRP